MSALITPLLLFIAFLLLLLISLSAPIVDSIYLFKLALDVHSRLFTSGASASVDFGVWGYCVSAIHISAFGLDRSSNSQCSDARLGYTFDDNVAQALQVQDLRNLISRVTTGALILHPIVTGIIFIALLLSLSMHRRGSNGPARAPSILICAVSGLAALLTTVVFLLDVIFVAVVRSRVRDASDGSLTLSWGNAVWMALGATISLWLASITSGLRILKGRRQSKQATY